MKPRDGVREAHVRIGLSADVAEQGPHEDITGPVADSWNWFRADYVDRTQPVHQCNICDSAPATEAIEGTLYCEPCLDDRASCRECGGLYLKGTGPGLGFSTRSCLNATWE